MSSNECDLTSSVNAASAAAAHARAAGDAFGADSTAAAAAFAASAASAIDVAFAADAAFSAAAATATAAIDIDGGGHSADKSVWDSLTQDVNWYDSNANGRAAKLACQPLWLMEAPAWILRAVNAAQQVWREDPAAWSVWAEWYAARLQGRERNWPLPAMQDREMNDWLLEQTDDWWKREDIGAINAEIAARIAELKVPKEPVESDPQNPTAPALTAGPAHAIVIDRTAGQDQILTDTGAVTRHSAAREAFAKVAEQFRGSNNAGHISASADLVLAALTDSVATIEPALLVLHAETYRQVLAAQQAPEAGDNHEPLSAMALIVPRAAERACDLLIGSDPFLEAMDARQHGPDRERVTTESADVVELADALLADALTDPETDAALREAVSNAAARPAESRQRSFLTDFGLNVVRHANSLVFQHIERFSAFVPEGLNHAVSLSVAGFAAGGGMALLYAAWKLARNIKKNETQWRKIAGFAGVTRRNFDRLVALLKELPLE